MANEAFQFSEASFHNALNADEGKTRRGAARAGRSAADRFRREEGLPARARARRAEVRLGRGCAEVPGAPAQARLDPWRPCRSRRRQGQRRPQRHQQDRACPPVEPRLYSRFLNHTDGPSGLSSAAVRERPRTLGLLGPMFSKRPPPIALKSEPKAGLAARVIGLVRRKPAFAVGAAAGLFVTAAGTALLAAADPHAGTPAVRIALSAPGAPAPPPGWREALAPDSGQTPVTTNSLQLFAGQPPGQDTQAPLPGQAIITFPDGPPPGAPTADDRSPLTAAPITGLTAPGPGGTLLPIIGADGKNPYQAYARPFTSNGKPKVALVIGGLGLNAKATRQAIEQLPPEVTLSFVPYADGLQGWIDLARANGHEVLLEAPMEPKDYPDNDPGPYTLMTAATSADLTGKARLAAVARHRLFRRHQLPRLQVRHRERADERVRGRAAPARPGLRRRRLGCDERRRHAARLGRQGDRRPAGRAGDRPAAGRARRPSALQTARRWAPASPIRSPWTRWRAGPKAWPPAAISWRRPRRSARRASAGTRRSGGANSGESRRRAVSHQMQAV